MYTHGGNIYKIARDLNINKEEIIDFSSNINPGKYPKIIDKVIKSQLKKINYYPDPDYTDAKIEIGHYHMMNSDQVLLGNGAADLIHLYFSVLQPESALVIAPTFLEYEKALLRFNTKIDYFECREKDKFNINLNLLMEKLNSHYEVVVICNPNNPTGNFIEPVKMLEIVKMCHQKQTRLFIDESFIDFIHHSGEKSILKVIDPSKHNVCVLRSMTKFFSIPGLRLGYCIITDKKIKELIDHYRSPWSVNILACELIKVLYGQKQYIRETVHKNAKEAGFLFNLLSEISYLKVYPTYVNFFIIQLRDDFTGTYVYNALLQKNILIRKLNDFKFLNDKFIRVAVKDRRSNCLLVNQLSQLVRIK